MKAEAQIKKIAAKANQQGAKYILSNNKHGDFDLYYVKPEWLSHAHTFATFQEGCMWVAGQNQKVIFVPYIG